MSDRFNPADIARGHRKGLRLRSYTTARPAGRADRVAFALLYGVPLAVGLVAWFRHFTLAKPDSLLAAFGLLTGALFMAFTQVASWRNQFTERLASRQVTEVHQRDSLDEAVAHILMAIYASAILFALIVVGVNFSDKDGRLVSGWAAVSSALATYVLLLLFIVLPKLYTAYVVVNEVDDELSGLSR